jgi:hypothetical protein
VACHPTDDVAVFEWPLFDGAGPSLLLLVVPSCGR